MNLSIVPHTHVDQFWPDVKDMLDAALATGKGECTIDQLRMLVTSKHLHLITASNDSGITGAATIEFENLPNKRVAVVTAIGGRGLIQKDTFETLKNWCRTMGASEIRAHASDAQTRLNARVGFVKLCNVVGVEL